MTNDETLLTTKEVADFVGLSPYTIARYRVKGTGPKYFYLGKKTIRYKKDDVEAWLDMVTQRKKYGF